jgi:xanthine dehydrogenase iron-sulfur cluster and FAD-binding subunit A
MNRCHLLFFIIINYFIKQRLVESHGLQCGFCTPGFIMSAFALLRNNPNPTPDQVERAIEGIV